MPVLLNLKYVDKTASVHFPVVEIIIIICLFADSSMATVDYTKVPIKEKSLYTPPLEEIVNGKTYV